jgi:Flp pilus assembly protein TadG
VFLLSLVRKLLRDKKGLEQIIPFLVFLPFLLVMLIALAQVLVYGYSKMFVQQAAYVAARAGARYPSIDMNNTASTCIAYAMDAANKYGRKFLYDWDNRKTITIEFPDAADPNNPQPGDTIRVTIYYDFPKFPWWQLYLKFDMQEKVVGVADEIIEEVP